MWQQCWFLTFIYVFSPHHKFWDVHCLKKYNAAGRALQQVNHCSLTALLFQLNIKLCISGLCWMTKNWIIVRFRVATVWHLQLFKCKAITKFNFKKQQASLSQAVLLLSGYIAATARLQVGFNNVWCTTFKLYMCTHEVATKGTVKYFENYSYLLSCCVLNKKIDSTVMSEHSKLRHL